MVPYEDNNNDDDDDPSEYDYYCPNTDPNFGPYQLLMLIAYSGYDVNKLAYKAYNKHKQKIFNAGIMAISNDLVHAFDTPPPCAICNKVGHTFEGCKELQDLTAIQKSYIQLCVAIKGMGTSQGRDVGSLQSYKLSYVKSVNLLPPSSHQNTAFINCLKKAGRIF